MAAKRPADEGEAPRRVLVHAKSSIGPDDGGFADEVCRPFTTCGLAGQFAT